MPVQSVCIQSNRFRLVHRTGEPGPDLQPLIMSCSPVRCLWTHTGPKHSQQSLSLSEDLREVKWVGEDQSHPDHPERFDSRSQVLCREGLTGRCYWEVERRGCVDIGVTYRGITRRGEGVTASLEEQQVLESSVVMMVVTLPGTTVDQHPSLSAPLAPPE